jgi:alanine-glyoxylate transaminase/serine-glyoxylate transaminase/serine-pyruvate transaminase
VTNDPLHLMIPGPVAVEDDVLQAMSHQVLPHYGRDWLKVYNEAVQGLQQVFGTEGDLFLMAGPGSAGLDAGLGSLTRTGERVLVAHNGFFGQRLVTLARGYGLDVRTVEAPLGQRLDPQAIRRCLANETEFQALVVVHLETSTGVLNPLPEIAAVANEFGVPLIVDAVSSLGGVPMRVDEWGIDVCVSVINKCLACPPGVAPVTVSQRAWAQIERKEGRAHGWYLDLAVWKQYARDWSDWHPYPTTLPTNNILALVASLRRILGQGLDAHYERHKRAADQVREALTGWGFRSFAPEAYTSPLLSAMVGPPGVDVEDLRRYLLAEWQVMISGGLDELHGKILRVGHIGKAASPDYVRRLLDGVEVYLHRPRPAGK